MQISMDYWDDFVFDHVRVMKNMFLPLLCRNLAESLCGADIRIEESLWKTVIVFLKGHCSHPMTLITRNLKHTLDSCIILYYT